MTASAPKQLLHPTIRSSLIMLAAGTLASLLCAQVFAATLPIDAPAPAPVVSASATTQKVDDAAAAATLRAFIASHRSFAGIGPAAAQLR